MALLKNLAGMQRNRNALKRKNQEHENPLRTHSYAINSRETY